MQLNLESCSVNLNARSIMRDGHTIRLSGTEVALLQYLTENPVRVLSREEIYREVWKHQTDLETRALDLAVLRLRKKVESDPREPRHIMSVYGVGYSFVPLGEINPSDTEPEPVPVSHNLEREENRFVGREEELRLLDSLVDEVPGFVTIIGPPGIGKTRLVKHWASEGVLNTPVDGVWFCDLSETHDEIEIISSIARTLDISLAQTGADTEQLTGALARAIANRDTTLLILDNAEQVIEPLRRVVPVLIKLAPQTRLVITSQVAMGSPIERRLPLPPLPVPTASSAIRDNPAVQLFVERARTVQPQFACTKENEADIAALAIALDGLPLAIELAAGRAHLMSPKTLHRKLTQRSRLLSQSHPSGPRRHQTLWGAIQWSWDLLSPIEQSALAQCSVFSGGFDWEAAEAVIDLADWPDAPWSPDVIADLVDRSLIMTAQRADGETRLLLLESISVFTAERLDELTDLRPAVEERHARHFTNLAVEIEKAAAKGRPRPFGELENLLLATERAIDNAWMEMAEVGGIGTMSLLDLQGSFEQACTLAKRLLSLEVSSRGRTEIENSLGGFLISMGRYDEAATHCEKAIKLARDNGDRPNEGQALYHMGFLHQYRGRYEQALTLYEDGLTIAREIGDRRDEGRNLRSIGIVHNQQGRHEEALLHQEHALKIAREIGDRQLEGKVLGELGNVSDYHGHYEDALAFHQDALKISREIGDRRFECLHLLNIGDLHADRGHFEEALAPYEGGLKIARDTGLSRSEAGCLRGLGRAYRLLGALDDSRSFQDQAMIVLRELGDKEIYPECLCEWGHLRLLDGEAADKELSEARALVEELSIGPETLSGKAVMRLERAVAAIDRGEKLYHGQCLEDFPTHVQERLIPQPDPPA